MMELFTCGLNLDDKIFDKSEPTAAVGQADVPIPTATDRIDGRCRLPPARKPNSAACFGTGLAYVDLTATQHRGIIAAQRVRLSEDAERALEQPVERASPDARPCGDYTPRDLPLALGAEACGSRSLSRSSSTTLAARHPGKSSTKRNRSIA
jgi:hypothetical protein